MTEELNYIRLQKYLAQMGLGSRRKCEEYIADGKILINGKIVTEMGCKINPQTDKVTTLIDKKLEQENKIYIMLNKPAGVVTTCADHVSERTVLDLIDIKERVFPIGRLDKDTTGLLILTNDGTITQRLLHPKYNKEKEYIVTVTGEITKERINKLENGVMLFGEKTKQAKVKQIAKNKLSIILTEGKNRQVRRICRKVGLHVTQLHRIRINKLILDPNLALGNWKFLGNDKLHLLIS